MPVPFEVHEGDSLALARGLAPNSIDSLVTDPPAGISFCGKGWDDDKGGRDEWIAWLQGIMKEAWRVVKPGGYALVWAIPRTSHWTATAMENAGWRVCDIVHHLFGSGFPHGLDVGKAMDRMRDDDIYHVTAFIAEARDKAGKTNGEIDDHMGFAGMAGHWTSNKSQPAVPKWEYWLQLKAFLGFGDEMDEEVQRLNGRKGKPGDDWYERPIIGKVVDGVEGHVFRKGGVGPTYKKEFFLTGHVSAEAHEWDGWNTTLKPGAEHWILCQKPVEARNIAANVLKHGVGALNIKGCEIPRAQDDVPGWHESGADGSNGFLGTDTFKIDAQTPEEIKGRRGDRGRWPSNIVFSHSLECVCVGHRRIKGCPAEVKQGGQEYSGYRETGGERNTTFEGYGDSDGMELVEVWECVPGCPVGELEEASPGRSRFFNVFHWSPEELGQYYGTVEDVRGLEVVEWESEGRRVRLLVDTGQYPPKVTGVYGTPSGSVSEWSTMLFGNDTTDPFLKGCRCITETRTSSETQSETLNWLLRCLTSESTLGVRCETESSGNHVEGAGTSILSIIFTSERMEYLPGVGSVAAGTLQTITAKGKPGLDFPNFRYQPKPTRDEKEAGCENLPARILNRVNPGGLENDPRWSPISVRNNHPTCKSIGLMRWLCRLVTPKGGVVVDFFCGSGTTGCGAVLEGFGFLGFDKNEEKDNPDESLRVDCVAIARARIAHWAEKSENGGRVLSIPTLDGVDWTKVEIPARRTGKREQVCREQQAMELDF